MSILLVLVGGHKIVHGISAKSWKVMADVIVKSKQGELKDKVEQAERAIWENSQWKTETTDLPAIQEQQIRCFGIIVGD